MWTGLNAGPCRCSLRDGPFHVVSGFSRNRNVRLKADTTLKGQFSCTDISLDTPGSSIVTP